MKPFRLATAIAIACLAVGHADAGDGKGFRLTVDGVELGINPGDTLDVTTKDGRKISVELQRSETVTFSGSKFSFDHDGKFSVARTDLGSGVQQYALMTPIGTGIIVQEYKKLNPAGLTDFVLQQMVQESVSAGAKIKKEATQRTLSDGRALKGVKAETTTENDVMEYEVVAAGKPSGGVLVVTIVNKENIPTEGGIFDKLWSSLKVEF